MIKAIIFDFDGVIVESAKIKTDAFRVLFEGYPEHASDILIYHRDNMGISRYIKFRHIYKNILNKALPKKQEIILGKRFSDLVLDGVLRAPFVNGLAGFFRNNRDKYKFFIVSGTPEKELLDIVHKRGIAGFFEGVYGSPRRKCALIKMILRQYRLKREQVIFVGDALNDIIAAQEAEVNFVLRNNSENRGQFRNYGCVEIDSFLKFNVLVNNIGKKKKGQ